MRIDIVFDTICPWCYIGKKRLETSLAHVALDDLDIQWNAFLLNPEMPAGGMDPGEYARTKFGGEARARRVHAAIKRTGEAAGIELRLDRISWVPNTINSHRLIRFAEREGRASEVVEAVFQSYFLEGHNIGIRSTLTDIGAKFGLDGTELARYLAGNEDRAPPQGPGVRTALRQGARSHNR